MAKRSFMFGSHSFINTTGYPTYGRSQVRRAQCHHRTKTTSLIGLIDIAMDPSEISKALEDWKKRMRTANDPTKVMRVGKAAALPRHARTYFLFRMEIDIEAYLNSAAHEEILRHSRSLKGSKAVVKLYDLVE